VSAIGALLATSVEITARGSKLAGSGVRDRRRGSFTAFPFGPNSMTFGVLHTRHLRRFQCRFFMSAALSFEVPGMRWAGLQHGELSQVRLISIPISISPFVNLKATL
jgi:hypothetical protein